MTLSDSWGDQANQHQVLLLTIRNAGTLCTCPFLRLSIKPNHKFTAFTIAGLQIAFLVKHRQAALPMRHNFSGSKSAPISFYFLLISRVRFLCDPWRLSKPTYQLPLLPFSPVFHHRLRPSGTVFDGAPPVADRLFANANETRTIDARMDPKGSWSGKPTIVPTM